MAMERSTKLTPGSKVHMARESSPDILRGFQCFLLHWEQGVDLLARQGSVKPAVSKKRAAW